MFRSITTSVPFEINDKVKQIVEKILLSRRENDTILKINLPSIKVLSLKFFSVRVLHTFKKKYFFNENTDRRILVYEMARPLKVGRG